MKLPLSVSRRQRYPNRFALYMAQPALGRSQLVPVSIECTQRRSAAVYLHGDAWRLLHALAPVEKPVIE
jgi:hypothetical protein